MNLRLRKQVYIYFSTYFFNAALSFATVSLLTYYLSTYDYGVLNLYSSFLIFLTPFITGGILYPLSVQYYKRSPEDYRNYFTQAQVIPLVSLAVFTILCVVFQRELSGFLKVPVWWVWVMPVTAWWIMINETVMIIARNKNKAYQFAFFSIGKTVVEIGITVIFVVGLTWNYEGRLLSAAITPVLLGLIGIYFITKWRLITKRIEWKEVRRIFLLCLPFIFERLAVFVMGYSDKYFIDNYDLNGTREVGLYGLGSQLASIIYLVIISMSTAYQPYLFEKLAGGFKKKLHVTTYWYIAACAVTVVGMFIALPFLFRYFIGDDFQGAKPYAYLLCSGYFMWGVFNAFQSYMIYLEKNNQIFLISFLGMITSLSLNFILVPKLGAEGAAYASIITYSVMAIICFFMVRKYFLLKHE